MEITLTKQSFLIRPTASSLREQTSQIRRSVSNEMRMNLEKADLVQLPRTLAPLNRVRGKQARETFETCGLWTSIQVWHVKQKIWLVQVDWIPPLSDTNITVTGLLDWGALDGDAARKSGVSSLSLFKQYRLTPPGDSLLDRCTDGCTKPSIDRERILAHAT